MVAPIIRLMVNAVAMGAGAVAKAFAKAYQQAASRGGAAAAEEAASGASGQTLAQRLSKRMRSEEARQILNVKKETAPTDVHAAYERLFIANDVSKGGSFYLQSKIFRSRQALEDELKIMRKAQSVVSTPSTANSPNAQPKSNPFLHTTQSGNAAPGQTPPPNPPQS